MMELDGGHRVPDALYEALQDGLGLYQPPDYGPTPEELLAGRLLRVHRDWLNGGFSQVFWNFEALEVPTMTFVRAYSELGLTAAAAIVAEAASMWPLGELLEFESLPEERPDLDDVYERLDHAYERLAYPDTDSDQDAIEAIVVEYIWEHQTAFAHTITRASK